MVSLEMSLVCTLYFYLWLSSIMMLKIDNKQKPKRNHWFGMAQRLLSQLLWWWYSLNHQKKNRKCSWAKSICNKIFTEKKLGNIFFLGLPDADFRAKLLTSFVANLLQEINSVSSFNRCFNGTFSWRNCSVRHHQKWEE